MILLDTNILIRILHNKISFIELKNKVSTQEKFGTTAISLHEIYFGLFQLKYRKDITLNTTKWEEEFNSIKSVENKLIILAFNSKAAEISSELFNILRYQGDMIDIFDCMIAGNIKAYGFTQIINTNKKHFQKIPDLEVIEF